MPTMQMPRNFTVRTRSGHTLVFEKGVPIHVPDDLVVIEECQRFGAAFVSPTDQEQILKEEEASRGRLDLPKTPAERRERILTLMRDMALNQENHRSHFTAANRPSARYVQSTLKFDVSAQEVEELWQTIAFPNAGVEAA
jgi:hypothetical protein